MEIKTIWLEETRVKTYETDFQMKWKPGSFFQVMLDAATNHAMHLGFGYHTLMERNMAWILSRIKIVFHDYPSIGECVTVQTWPKHIQQKLFFVRDFRVFGPESKHLASASAAWLLIDYQERRMLLPAALPGSLPATPGMSALDEPLEKIAPPRTSTSGVFRPRTSTSGMFRAKEMTERLRIQPGYSSVDMLGHVNSTRYLEWICDCFSMDEHRCKTLEWVQINYSNEVLPGEQVSVAMGQQEGSPGLWLAEGSNLTTGMKAFEAAARWRG